MNFSKNPTFATHVVNRMQERGKLLSPDNVPEIEASMTTLEIPRTLRNIEAVQREINFRIANARYDEARDFRGQTLAAMRL